jgi:D-alanyl-lipoteichoic acid acyltransferase DltB (MBOAT superfamily)
MLFNSLDFAIFLPIVFGLYWFVFKRSLKLQNLLVAAASYVFYGWWDWRFLSLILFSSLVDYTISLFLTKTDDKTKRKLLLWASLGINLGLLGFFKYYNFFIDNFTQAFTFFGHNIKPTSLNVILPVGISFYTFQTLSYTIDVYRKQLQPTRDFIAFSAFVSFFPQLVAGPIERASNLLPQFYTKREFNYTKAVDGMRQILWGLFKKVVIADNCAEYANQIFNNSEGQPGGVLLLGVLFFAFQIYGDFSGYSDIAIGTARLFGFNLMKNFAFPYFSRDMAEFWRRWHISLSTWFRDYVYIPLGGSRVSTTKAVRNTFVIFVVSGFWHGANWTFIVWGALNAIYFLPLLLAKKNRRNTDNVAEGRILPNARELGQMLGTFGLTLLAWVFFRADNVGHATSYLYTMATNLLQPFNPAAYAFIIGLIMLFVAIEWRGRTQEFALARLAFTQKPLVRMGVYIILVLAIAILGGKEQEFIYFQF